MRARNIKPGICKNDELADCSAHARLLFIYLWMMADRDGRLENKPRKIKAECFPYEHELDIVALIGELDKFLELYGADSEYIQITNFAKHQNPHKNEKPSDIKSIEESRVITGQVQEPQHTTRADSLIEDSLIPDSLIDDSPPKKKTVSRFAPPSLDEVKAYCLERKNTISPQGFIDSYEAKGWMIGRNKMKSWKAAVRTWEQNQFNTGGNNGSGNKANNGRLEIPTGEVDWTEGF